MKTKDIILMRNMRKAGMKLSELGVVFGVTKQAIYYNLGPTYKLIIKKFEASCAYCGKDLSYSARKEKVRPPKYCGRECFGMGNRTLDIPYKSHTKEYERMRSAIQYERFPEKRLKYCMKYYHKNKEKIKEYMRNYYWENRERLLAYHKKRNSLAKLKK